MSDTHKDSGGDYVRRSSGHYSSRRFFSFSWEMDKYRAAFFHQSKFQPAMAGNCFKAYGLAPCYDRQ